MRFAVNYKAKGNCTTMYIDTDKPFKPVTVAGLTISVSVQETNGFINITDEKPPLSCRCPLKWICRKVAGLFGYKSCCQPKPACCKGK